MITGYDEDYMGEGASTRATRGTRRMRRRRRRRERWAMCKHCFEMSEGGLRTG